MAARAGVVVVGGKELLLAWEEEGFLGIDDVKSFVGLYLVPPRRTLLKMAKTVKAKPLNPSKGGGAGQEWGFMGGSMVPPR